jgi:transposase
MEAARCFLGSHMATVPTKEIMDTVTEFTEVKSAHKYWRSKLDEKNEIIEEAVSSGFSVAEIACGHEMNANQVFDRRSSIWMDNLA